MDRLQGRQLVAAVHVGARQDSRSPRDGRFLEIVGRYNPQTDPSTIELDETKVKDWLGKGAQPTEAVAKLIKISGIEK